MTRDEVTELMTQAGMSIAMPEEDGACAILNTVSLPDLERLIGIVEAKTKEAAYKAGWIAAAKWADRADLIADTDSPAYIAERNAAIHTSKGAS